MRWSPFFALATAAASAPAAAAPPLGELRDLAPPVEMPDDPVWHLYLAVAICVALIAAAIIFVARRRRPIPVVPPVPPQRRALEALAQLENATMEAKVFYAQLVDILRAYIAGRFGIDEPDATASELLAVMFERTPPALEHQRLLRALVSESEMVKFAGRMPLPDAPARALHSCREFVRETAEEEVHLAF